MKRSIFLLFAIVSVAGMIAISGCKMLDGESYTVTFDANGGEGNMPSQIFFEGNESALYVNEFTREGYSFAGWNTMQDGTGTAYTDKQRITVVADMTLYAQWSTTGTLNGHNYVNLGLPSGTLWATCNVGATTPEEYGDFFAWGETVPKSTYHFRTYKYCNGSETALTKYCSNAEYGYNGFTDNLTTLEACDDAATANWGAGWRMPTEEEFEELRNNCTMTWTTQNGEKGRLFTGPNGSTIFLPAGGYYGDQKDHGFAGSFGDYWSSSLYTGEQYRSVTLSFNSSDSWEDNGLRCLGLSVRPVCQSQN